MKKGPEKDENKSMPETPGTNAHDDLNEFIKTRETIAEMIRFRSTHDQPADMKALEDFRHRALNAINHLFDEDKEEKKE
jgi:hypothetical protein